MDFLAKVIPKGMKFGSDLVAMDGRTAEEAPEPASGQSEHRLTLISPTARVGSIAPGTHDEPKKLLSILP